MHLYTEPPYIEYHHFPKSKPTKTHRLIFLIPGNPGCISYYESFLAHLTDLLRTDRRVAASFSVVGTSLGNFSSTLDEPKPFSLQGQIEFVEKAIWRSARECVPLADIALLENGHAAATPTLSEATVRVRVTLIGHSVGAYIGMEILRRWKEGLVPQAKGGENQEGSGAGHKVTTTDVSVDIVSYIGLWPTITHIAKSPSGRRLRWMLRRSYLALFTSLAAYALTLLLPAPMLLWLVGYITKFPVPALATTTAFLSRPYSVRQALHMARDEMNEIIEDRWADDIWHAGNDGPSLTLLFGLEDHWVAADAREELMRNRKSTQKRTGASMEIDDMGIPHSFCIRDSKAVAERTSKLVSKAIDGE